MFFISHREIEHCRIEVAKNMLRQRDSRLHHLMLSLRWPHTMAVSALAKQIYIQLLFLQFYFFCFGINIFNLSWMT